MPINRAKFGYFEPLEIERFVRTRTCALSYKPTQNSNLQSALNRYNISNSGSVIKAAAAATEYLVRCAIEYLVLIGC